MDGALAGSRSVARKLGLERFTSRFEEHIILTNNSI